MKSTPTRVSKVQQAYKNLNLALRVRAQTTSLIQKFDSNHNGIFEENEIIDVLKSLIQADETELRYVTSNMFRYDKDNDGIIGPKDLINFFLEVSWGEIAIQRLHRKGYYKNGSARMIDAQQFFATMKYILTFIQLQANEQQVSTLYQQIDTNADGLISYNQYFTFLRTYFGSQSQACITQNQVQIPKKPQLPEDLILDGRDRFKRLVLSQSRLMFIGYNVSHNLKFSREEIKSLLQDLFLIPIINIEPLVERIITTNYLQDFQKLTKILVLLQFGELSLSKLHSEGSIAQWKTKMLKKQDFVKLIRTSCSYMNVLPDKQLISALFNQLSTNDSPVSYSNYRSFITNIFSPQQKDNTFLRDQLTDPSGFIRQRVISPRTTFTGQNKMITDACWRQIQKIFKKYDLTNTGISKVELQEVISIIFKNITPHQKNVLVWSSLNQVDSQTIKLSEFAPWAFKKLFRHGFVSYFSDPNSTSSLRMNVDQFKKFIRSVFWFLPAQLEPELSKLYDSMNQNKQNLVEKNQIQNWISKKLCIRQ